ncbi:MAG: hypothetical protein MZV70_39345 [Desulfobacterales bacterium]|nr:hypothetical protein [Desulfobacterales bacterium]
MRGASPATASIASVVCDQRAVRRRRTRLNGPCSAGSVCRCRRDQHRRPAAHEEAGTAGSRTAVVCRAPFAAAGARAPAGNYGQLNDEWRHPMRKPLSLRTCLLLALPGCTQSAPPAPPAKIVAMEPQAVSALLERRVTRNFVPGEVVVKMKPAAPGAALRVMPSAELRRLNLEVRRDQTSGGEVIYRLPPATVGTMAAKDVRDRTLAAVKSLAARTDVEYAQPNYIFQIAATLNDSAYPQQWHYFDNGSAAGRAPGGINLPSAVDTQQGQCLGGGGGDRHRHPCRITKTSAARRTW